MKKPTISREDAYAQSLKFFFTGKACRAGHIADRYTSGGNCVECLKIGKTKQNAKNLMRRRRHNAMMARDDFSFILSIPLQWRETFQRLQEIAPRANEEQTGRMQAIIEAMHEETRNPFVTPQNPMRPTRTVNRADILRVVDWRDNKVQNLASLEVIELTEDNPVLVKIGIEYYVAEHVMRCLHGILPIVDPYNPNLTP